eukprot:GSMAST32.ASY1.ANO1.874.1 assembled CDS
MDCDREGENINFEVLDDILKAYNSLIRPNKNESLSVDARQELDLKIGVAFSRFQTKYFQGRYGNLDSSVISYGPCQTPTLGFCVQRHLDILSFVPKAYWTLDLRINKNGIRCLCTSAHGRYFKRSKALDLLGKIKNAPDAQVKVLTALNTVGFLKACSKGLCIGPHAAMQLAERLYLMGYVSYPRTESTTYPASFSIEGTLKEPDAIWQCQTVKFEVSLSSQQFIARGKKLKRAGFLDALKGETFPLTSVDQGRRACDDMSVISLSNKKETVAPSHLSESELISLMERHGIGTDASIPSHIENIQKRNYATLGIRSQIESECVKIAKAISVFSAKFDHFMSNIDSGKPFSRCGLTRRYLHCIQGPPPRFYNRLTETIYPMPQGGILKPWSDRYCTVCDFELCLYSCGNPQRTFPLCPYCYNNPKPEWGSISNKNQKHRRGSTSSVKRNLVLNCPLPDLHPSIQALVVYEDIENGGFYILDPTGGPKWKLVNTRNASIQYFPSCVARVKVMKKVDSDMKCAFLKVEFKKGQSLMQDGADESIDCFLTNKILRDNMVVRHGSERLKWKRHRGGRGRGRRKGRGRGRRKHHGDIKMTFDGF